MDLDNYNQTLNNLKTQLTQLMDQLDALDPADERYESMTDKMISIQKELIALDAKYNAESKR